MKSEKQLEAARLNGAKSNGPITPEGKANSSRNAITHGLLATTVLLKGESRERFLELLTEFTDLYEPRNITERSLVETMAMARWRTLRLWTFEKWFTDGKLPPDAPETATGTVPFEATWDFVRTAGTRPDLILRYETMYHTHFHRALKQLLTLQKDGGTPVPQPVFRPASKDVAATERTQQVAETKQTSSENEAEPCRAGWQPAADWQSAPSSVSPAPSSSPHPPLPFPSEPVKISVATESRGPQTGRGA
jgi:hypothetical protein